MPEHATKSDRRLLSAPVARELIRQLKSVDAGGTLDLSEWALTPAAARILLGNAKLVIEAQGLAHDDVDSDVRFCLDHLDFLVRLHNLAASARNGGLVERVACAKHLFAAPRQLLDEILRHRAYAIFGFGPRQFDSLFEMGDGGLVREALVRASASDAAIARCCQEMGWDEVARRRDREIG